MKIFQSVYLVMGNTSILNNTSILLWGRGETFVYLKASALRIIHCGPFLCKQYIDSEQLIDCVAVRAHTLRKGFRVFIFLMFTPFIHMD